MHQNGGEGSFKVIENVALLLVPNHVAKPFLEFTENGAKKEKISSEWQFPEQKCLFDTRGQRNIVRLLNMQASATKEKHSLQLRDAEEHL